MVLIAIQSSFAFSEDNLLKIHFISVGYGDSIFIEMPDKSNLLIDSGHKKYSEKVISYLLSQIQLSGVDKLNAVILTHPHQDHFGSLDKIFETIPVDKLYYNSDERDPHKGYFAVMKKVREIIEPTVLQRGDKLTFSSGDVELMILDPKDISGTTNDSTIVAWLKYGGTSVLLSSDIQIKKQDQIMRAFDFIKDSDFVQIPHHGGYVSQEFASFFNTKKFILSTGPEYGKPYEEEVNKFKGKVYRTDKMGTIVIESDGKNMWVVNE
ncbi:MAG: MBL fold metallo-hydrolase [Candidatus Omnitrophica bacterium]|nr:MBL fold metallo-hydrolase [Candidatus Omnitrophota bacterium]MBU1995710.1 MBL fold metallo-hydrolase [Candidatus Omnitrophota bacterium]MBU4334504.1 MBL fold metallo-hydrolase [Candidatus Omnitrophota bacterium]